MKYYGIKKKLQHESILYAYAKAITRIHRDDDLTGNSEILNQLNGGYATPQDEDKIRFIPSLAFCSSVSIGAKEVKKDIEILTTEFEDKKSILLNLSDYKNTIRSIRLNRLMLLISFITLFFIIFPNRVDWMANIIRSICRAVITPIKWLLN